MKQKGVSHRKNHETEGCVPLCKGCEVDGKKNHEIEGCVPLCNSFEVCPAIMKKKKTEGFVSHNVSNSYEVCTTMTTITTTKKNYKKAKKKFFGIDDHNFIVLVTMIYIKEQY